MPVMPTNGGKDRSNRKLSRVKVNPAEKSAKTPSGATIAKKARYADNYQLEFVDLPVTGSVIAEDELRLILHHIGNFMEADNYGNNPANNY